MWTWPRKSHSGRIYIGFPKYDYPSSNQTRSHVWVNVFVHACYQGTFNTLMFNVSLIVAKRNVNLTLSLCFFYAVIQNAQLFPLRELFAWVKYVLKLKDKKQLTEFFAHLEHLLFQQLLVKSNNVKSLFVHTIKEVDEDITLNVLTHSYLHLIRVNHFLEKKPLRYIHSSSAFKVTLVTLRGCLIYIYINGG